MRPIDARIPGDLGSERALLLDQQAKLPHSPHEHWRQCFPEIVGRSPAMMRVLETIYKVARTDSAVLILGESGVGKELVAASIHRLSQRTDKPYVTINSSAIPENLLESELFGHEKGAFTSADRRRLGRFDEAAGGTLFLDEIGDMPLPLQSKLLRVLQDKRYTPLGGNEVKEADVRIIAATNMDLPASIARGSFRLDLYYRLNVLPVIVPPLRERQEDIPALLEYFVDIANREQSHVEPSFVSDEAMRALCAYDWPGNVRQLQNLLKRLVVLRGGGAIELGDLPPEVLDSRLGAIVTANSVGAGGAVFAASARLSHASAPMFPSSHQVAPNAAANAPKATLPGGAPIRYPSSFGRLPEEGLDLVRYVEDLENDLIRQALERTGNNRNQAAKLLGLNRTTLVERIKKRKLTPLNEPSKEL